jgi:hypothetical protein
LYPVPIAQDWDTGYAAKAYLTGISCDSHILRFKKNFGLVIVLATIDCDISERSNCSNARDSTAPLVVGPETDLYELDTTLGSVEPELKEADIEPLNNSKLELVYDIKTGNVDVLEQLCPEILFSTSSISSNPIFF